MSSPHLEPSKGDQESLPQYLATSQLHNDYIKLSQSYSQVSVGLSAPFTYVQAPIRLGNQHQRPQLGPFFSDHHPLPCSTSSPRGETAHSPFRTATTSFTDVSPYLGESSPPESPFSPWGNPQGTQSPIDQKEASPVDVNRYLNLGDEDMNQNMEPQSSLSQTFVPVPVHLGILPPNPHDGGAISIPPRVPPSPSPSSEYSFSSHSSDYGGHSDGSAYGGDTTGSEDMDPADMVRLITQMNSRQENRPVQFIDPRAMSASFGISSESDSIPLANQGEHALPSNPLPYTQVHSLFSQYPTTNIDDQVLEPYPSSLHPQSNFSQPTGLTYPVYVLPPGIRPPNIPQSFHFASFPTSVSPAHFREDTSGTLRGDEAAMVSQDGTLKGTTSTAGTMKNLKHHKKARKSLADAFGSEGDDDDEAEDDDDLPEKLDRLSPSDDLSGSNKPMRSSSAARPRGGRRSTASKSTASQGLTYPSDQSKETRGRKPPRFTEAAFAGSTTQLDPETGTVMDNGLTLAPGEVRGPMCGSIQAVISFSGYTKTGKVKKWFGCPGNNLDCRKVFRRSEHWKRHVRTVHLREKPFTCTHPGCGKSISRSDNFRQHQRTHNCHDPCCRSISPDMSRDSSMAPPRRKKKAARPRDDDLDYSEDD